MKRLIQRNLQRFGVEIRRTEFARMMEFITARKIGMVLDVGANVGQFGETLRANGYRGKIRSFEPIPTVFQTLAAKAAADGNWEANNFGLGVRAGPVSINVTEHSVFSSIMPATTAAIRFDASAAIRHAETIEIRRLDDICGDLADNTLLKVDTQGYEQQVLEGGTCVLPLLKGVLLELPIIHLYHGTWQFHEAIQFMLKAGFVPAQIHPVNYHSEDRTSLVEVDCLFRPRDERLD